MSRQPNLAPLLGIILALLTLCGQARTPLTIWSDEWYPLNGQPNAQQPGFGIEIVQAIVADSPWTLQYQLAPWNRSIREVRRGTVDCVIGALKAEVPDFVFPHQEIHLSQNAFFVRDDQTWRYQNIDSLAQIRFGAIKDYAYDAALDAYIQAHPQRVELISGVDPVAQNIAKLIAGRFDAMLGDYAVIQAKLAELDHRHVVILAGISSQNNVYLACSPAQAVRAKSQQIVNVFDQGMARLRANGKLATILGRYHLTDWRTRQ